MRLTSPPPYVEADPADTRTAPSHPISELLRWAKAVVPDYRIGRSIADSPVLFGMASDARRVREPPTILPPQSFMPSLWADAWSRRIAELREELRRTGSAAFHHRQRVPSRGAVRRTRNRPPSNPDRVARGDRNRNRSSLHSRAERGAFARRGHRDQVWQTRTGRPRRGQAVERAGSGGRPHASGGHAYEAARDRRLDSRQ